MKVTPRFMVRAALGLTAAGVIGAFGACKDGSGPPPVEPPPPPPSPGSGIVAPSGLTATAASQTRIDLAWTDNANNETGFRVERCTGEGCSNFAQIGSNLEANVVAFADTFGLAANTLYNYRVAAFNATDTSTFATGNARTLQPEVSNQFTLLTVGEIMTCLSSAGPEGTARVVNEILTADTSAIVVTAGDNLAGADGAATFQDCFEPKAWGQLKSRARFALGNGDFAGGRSPSDVYAYFGDRTGPASQGWFSFDKGNWHVVVLNTSTREHGAAATFGIVDGDPATPGFQETRVPSAQVDWLTADLAANTKPCVAVISWERRLYTSSTGNLGRNIDMKPMVQLMYDNGVDLLISAKDHVYERFPQTNTDGVVDTEKGFRQFIVGTGGTTTWDIQTPATSNVEAQGNAWGVLKLTLGEASYKWEFLPTITGGFTDSGETACH